VQIRRTAAVIALISSGLISISPGLAGAQANAISIPSPFCRARTTPISTAPATLAQQTTVPNTGGRVLDLVLNSPAMQDQQHVDVLLPRHYDPATKYPVLYLLHGAGGSYDDWVRMGVENDIDYTSTADHLGPFITVMPDDGAWGFYTDWYGADLNTSATAPIPAWSTYDIDELIPFIDSHFPVITTRSGRAIAGLSMGGYGAMSYAARYPDLFSAAGSFSGVTDLDLAGPVGGESLNLLSTAFTRGPPNQCVWGDTITQGVRFHAGDPTYLASNLASTSLFVASGNGQQGPYDTPTSESTVADGAEESLIYLLNEAFTSALSANGVTYTKYFYGNGTHSWGYWLRDLAHFLPQMSAAFTQPKTVSTTAPFTYRSVDTSFEIHGYQFSINHDAEAFTYLNSAGPDALTAIGTGTVSVLTPPNYIPGGSYRVTDNAVSTIVKANQQGQLSYQIGLGPPTPLQQFFFTSNDPNGFPIAYVTVARLK
jgi:S-formylglutathione hydrolase FrmB